MKTYARNELAAFWRSLGLAPGHAVLCHSFIASLGRPQTSLSEDALGSLLDVVGEGGTVFAPTFTYSFFNGEVFDVQNSPSTVGAFGDVVRTHPAGVRSHDPVFSNAGVGRHAASFLARTSQRSLGPGTFYDRFIQGGGMVLLIGVDFTALPLFMHIERMNEVPYRSEKRFDGIVRDNGTEAPDHVIHYVRDLSMKFGSDRSGVGREIDADPTCRRAIFGYGTHRFVPASTVVRVAETCLRRDPYSLIKFVAETA